MGAHHPKTTLAGLWFAGQGAAIAMCKWRSPKKKRLGSMQAEYFPLAILKRELAIIRIERAGSGMIKEKIDSPQGQADGSAAEQIEAKIKALGDWRGETLARVRALIKQADPDVVEELKWRGVPVWSHAGIICTGETYKHAVKLTFAKGAALADPAGLFNASLQGNSRRAIDLHKGDNIDEQALTALIRAAVALNTCAQ